MSIAEYTPRGGWYNYNRRCQLRRSRIKAALASMVAGCAYAVASTVIYYL